MKPLSKTVNKYLILCIALFLIISNICYAQKEKSCAASTNSWYVSGMFSMYYNLPIQEDDYTEDGFLILNINPRVIWFPADGFGAGIDADFYYSSADFGETNFGIGPRITYFLKNNEDLKKWMPYAGVSFQYLRNHMEVGDTETGWRLKIGVGISPIFGQHLTIPLEVGFLTEQLKSENSKEISYTNKISRIYIEIGLGAFL